jgi:uncharacterized protein YegP (UPF0339 family)
VSDHVETYKDEAGEHRWHRVAANGNIVADSGEGYVNKADMLRMAERINPGIPIVEEGSGDDGEAGLLGMKC